MFIVTPSLQIPDELAATKTMIDSGNIPSIEELHQCATLPSAASWTASAVRQPSTTSTPASNRKGLLVQQLLHVPYDHKTTFHEVDQAIVVHNLEHQLSKATAAAQQADPAAAAAAAAVAAKLQKQISVRRARAPVIRALKLEQYNAKAEATRKLAQDEAAGQGVSPIAGTDSEMADSQLLLLAQLSPVELKCWLNQLSVRGWTVGHARVDSSTAGTDWHTGGVSDAYAALLAQGVLLKLAQLRKLLAEGVGSAPEPPAGTLLAAAAARDPVVKLLAAVHKEAVAVAAKLSSEEIVAIRRAIDFIVGE